MLRRLLLPFALAATAALLVVSPLCAETAQASGKFSGKNWEFEAAGAYAYPGVVGFDDEPGIRVAVSNSVFRADVLDRYWDREKVISDRFADEETLVLTFQFGKDGSYKGMSYYFGSGDGCAFCYDGSVNSTVKIAGGRLKGKLALAPKPDENSWDFDLDIPVAPSDYGTPLPADGGEIGVLYAAYHKALEENDGAALAKIFPAELAAKLVDQKDQIISAWSKDHPTQSYRVIKGFTKGDRSLLLVEGETPYFKCEVEAHFLNEGGTWKLDDELMKVKLGEE
jgi:hypothetical protein